MPRVAVVTGAASGIGRALALAFAADGYAVHLVDVHAERLRDAVAAAGPRAEGHRLDCRDPFALQVLADVVLHTHGRVDVVCNNAGVLVARTFDRTTDDDWRWLLDLNVMGVVHGMRAFLPILLAQGHGTVVNTSSIAGIVAFPGLSTYSAAKHAVVALSRSVDGEVRARGVRVLALCPGAVNTGLAAGARLDPRTAAAMDRSFRVGADPATVARDALRGIEAGTDVIVTPAVWRAFTASPRLAAWAVRTFVRP